MQESTEDVTAPWLLPEMVSRVADMLNYFLDHLAGLPTVVAFHRVFRLLRAADVATVAEDPDRMQALLQVLSELLHDCLRMSSCCFPIPAQRN